MTNLTRRKVSHFVTPLPTWQKMESKQPHRQMCKCNLVHLIFPISANPNTGGIRKYVFWCCACGGLATVLGALFLAVYFLLRSYTSTLGYFETIPTFVPATMVSASPFKTERPSFHDSVLFVRNVPNPKGFPGISESMRDTKKKTLALSRATISRLSWWWN